MEQADAAKLKVQPLDTRHLYFVAQAFLINSRMFMPRSLTLAFLLVASFHNAIGVEPPPKLAPGSSITIAFPEMPLTFYDLLQKKQDKAQMTIFLPSNYDPGRKFPLLIFLNGWDGGPGGNPAVARSLCEGNDFVCVSVPLFKAPGFEAKEPNVPGPGFIMVAEDGKYMWPFFKTMLEKLEVTVPNLDPKCRVLGGFSNGAHATAVLIDGSDGEVTRQFTAFLLVEGGGRLEHYERLKGKPLLVVSSNSKSKPRAQEICDTAKAAGAQARLLVEDVGKHDFPVSAYPAVRQWLLTVSGK